LDKGLLIGQKSQSFPIRGWWLSSLANDTLIDRVFK